MPDTFSDNIPVVGSLEDFLLKRLWGSVVLLGDLLCLLWHNVAPFLVLVSSSHLMSYRSLETDLKLQLLSDVSVIFIAAKLHLLISYSSSDGYIWSGCYPVGARLPISTFSKDFWRLVSQWSHSDDRILVYETRNPSSTMYLVVSFQPVAHVTLHLTLYTALRSDGVVS